MKSNIMKTKMMKIALITATACVFVCMRPLNALPPDLRAAAADFNTAIPVIEKDNGSLPVPIVSRLAKESPRPQSAMNEEFTDRELPTNLHDGGSGSPVIVNGQKHWDFIDEQLIYSSESEAGAALAKWLAIFNAQGVTIAKSEIPSHVYPVGPKQFWFKITYTGDEYIESFQAPIFSKQALYATKDDARKAMERSVAVLNENGAKVFYATTVLTYSGYAPDRVYTYYIYYFVKYDPERTNERKVNSYLDILDSFASGPLTEPAMENCRAVFERAGIPLVSIAARGSDGLYGYLAHYIGKYSDVIPDYGGGFWSEASAKKAMEKRMSSLEQSGEYVIEGSVSHYHGLLGMGYGYTITRLAR